MSAHRPKPVKPKRSKKQRQAALAAQRRRDAELARKLAVFERVMKVAGPMAALVTAGVVAELI